jgi:hypothetical protein
LFFGDLEVDHDFEARKEVPEERKYFFSFLSLLWLVLSGPELIRA